MRLALPLAISATLAVAAGCRGFEHDTGPYDSCDATALEPGRVRARRMPCDDEGISGGEGRRADYLIENAWVRFVVRHPGAPLTLLHGGGGTIIMPPGRCMAPACRCCAACCASSWCCW